MVDNPSGGKVCCGAIKSDFSARLPEQSDAVGTCKKSSHSIFVLIYNDIYHFYGQTRWFQKGTRTSQLTQHIVYESRSHFQERRKTNNVFFLRFRFTKTRKCPQISAAAVFESSFFLGERQNTRRRPSSFFFGLQLKWLRGTMQVYNLFKCLTRQKDDGGRLLMAK